ncbi:inositol monophosphatase family protein [Aestuariimicrobium soli]|uniref:inositol monophosphatase family protein n=1 Tax=Aestuariimicrobium soli TaxID=2035834 RepID=UPI003EB80CF0
MTTVKAPATQAVLEQIHLVVEEVIHPRWRNLDAGEIDEKRPGDLVTVADRESEEVLTEWFAMVAPDALVVGEEAVFSNPSLPEGLAAAELAYTVDPVDGTRNFASGSPDYGVMVAELRRGVTTRSWIVQPEHGRDFVAERGAGATLNGSALPALVASSAPRGMSSRRELHDVTIADDWQPVTETALCCAIDYPMLALGEVDFVCYWNLNPWDHLPGALLIRELGGSVALLEGGEYQLSLTQKGLVAGSSSEVTETVRRRWRQLLDERPAR